MRLFHRDGARHFSTTGNRRGAVLVAALVCLLVVMALLGAMLQGGLRAHRKLHLERDVRQTEFLLQAGCDRAAYRLAGESGFQGETWNLPAAAIAGRNDGRVTIEIAPAKADGTQMAKVVAEYPVGGETSVRRTRTFQITNNKP